MKNLTLENAITKTYGAKFSDTHIAGYKWAKENGVNTKDINTLSDSDFDKMEAAVTNGTIEMVVYDTIKLGTYLKLSKFDK